MEIKDVIILYVKKIFLFVVPIGIVTIYLDKIVIFINKIPAIDIHSEVSFTDRILFITFLALLWYSFETRQLKNATRKSNELQQTPLFVLLYDGNDLILRNEGKGIAYNVIIDPILFDEETFEFELLRRWYYCGVGESRKLHLTISKDSGLSRVLTPDFRQFLAKLLLKRSEAKFIIRYSSAIKRNDYQEFILRIKDYERDIIEIFPNI